MIWSLGRSGVFLVVRANVDEAIVGINVHNDLRPTWFQQLTKHSQELEAALGKDVEWKDTPEERLGQIWVRTGVGTRNKKNWPVAHKWMLEKMDAIDRVLRPIVTELEDSLIEE